MSRLGGCSACAGWAVEINPRHFGQLPEESVLEAAVASGCGGGGWSVVVPDLAAAGGVRAVVDGEPGLGEVALFEVVGGGGTVFDWDAEGWQSFVSDPDVPPILQE